MGPKTAEAYIAVRTMIQDGELGAGEKLPSERTLVARLGIGRTALRQVLAQLLAEGVLEVKERSGYFVAGPGVPAPAGMGVDDAALREKITAIVRRVPGNGQDEYGLTESIMGLFAQHHCASCDMHSCGERAPSSDLADFMANRLLDKMRKNEEGIGP